MFGMMAESQNFYLSLQDFDNHVKNTWKLGQDDLDFCDVTLACEDRYIQAHKFIIGSSSPVLADILRNISHQTPFIYLKGVKHKDMQNILSFMYQGEVKIHTEDLASFFDVVNDLKIKGLSKNIKNQNELFESNGNNISSSEIETIEPSSNVINDNVDDSLNTLMNDTSTNVDLETEDFKDIYNSKTESASDIQDLLFQNKKKKRIKHSSTATLCEKCNKQYSCAKALRDHIRVVHEGFRFTCDHCDFTSKDQSYVTKHRKAVHMGVRYPCDNCNFIGFLRRDLLSHKQKDLESVPYNCKFCTYKDCRKGNLKRHMKVEHDHI